MATDETWDMDALLLVTKESAADMDVLNQDTFELGADIDSLVQDTFEGSVDGSMMLVFRRILGIDGVVAVRIDNLTFGVGAGLEISSRPRPYRQHTLGSRTSMGAGGRFG
jgi:hypothetical protein